MRFIRQFIQQVWISIKNVIVPVNDYYVVSTAVNTTPAVSNIGWNAIDYSPTLGLWTALAYDATTNRCMTSPDGLNWTAHAVSTAPQLVDLCWSPTEEIFVAVSVTTATEIWWSDDGISWNSVSTGDNFNLRKVCYSVELGTFAAVSQTANAGRQVSQSTTGKSGWTLRTTPAGNYRGVCWAKELSMFVACGFGTPHILTSPTGTSWTSQSTAGITANAIFTDIIWGADPGLLVAVGDDNLGSGDGIIITSPDGINWTEVTLPGTYSPLRGVAYSPNSKAYVAVGTDCAFTSTDGVSWTELTIPTNNWDTVRYSDDLKQFCAVASSGSSGNQVALFYDVLVSGRALVSEQGSVYFNGTNSYIDLGAALLPTDSGSTPFTIEMWIKRIKQGVDVDGYALSQYVSSGSYSGRSALSVSDSSSLGYEHIYWLNPAMSGGDAPVSINHTVTPEQEWHHVAVVQGSGSTRAYYDGVLTDTATGYSAAPNFHTLLGAGFNSDGVTPFRFFKGELKDIRIWDYERTEIEILTDMDYVLNGDETGLVAYYKTYDGSVLIDSTSNGNDGTLNNTGFVTSYGVLLDSYDPFLDNSGLAFWKLDGNGSDESGNYNLSSYGTVDYETDGSRLVYSSHHALDGNDYLYRGPTPDFKLNTITMSAWVNFTEIPSLSTNWIIDNHILSNGAGSSFNGGNSLWAPWYGGAPAAQFNVQNNETYTDYLQRERTTYGIVTYSPDRMINGRWYHLVTTFDYTNKITKLYIDGKFQNSTQSTQTPIYGTVLDNFGVGCLKYDDSTPPYISDCLMI